MPHESGLNVGLCAGVVKPLSGAAESDQWSQFHAHVITTVSWSEDLTFPHDSWGLQHNGQHPNLVFKWHMIAV